jgi:hypothetical protein
MAFDSMRRDLRARHIFPRYIFAAVRLAAVHLTVGRFHRTSMSQRRALKLVTAAEADEAVRMIFDEARLLLGLPQPPLLMQAWARHPKFLALAWDAWRGPAGSAEFQSLAARLRAEAFTRAHSYFPIPNLDARLKELRFSEGARQELHQAVELFHDADARLLLLAAASFRAFHEPVGAGGACIPAPHLPLRAPLVLIEDSMATPPVRRIFDEVRRTLESPFLPSHYRVYARWPDFLMQYWAALRRIVLSPVHRESRFATRDTAVALARELPGRIDFTAARLESADVGDSAAAAALEVTELMLKLLAAGVLNVAVAKIALEGGTGNREEAA